MHFRNAIFSAGVISGVAVLWFTSLPVHAATTSSPGVKKSPPSGEEAAANPANAPGRPSVPISLLTPPDTIDPVATPAVPRVSEPGFPQAGRRASSKELEFVGSVIYVKGEQVVAEVTDGAKLTERFRVYDSGYRLRGEVLAAKALDGVTFLLHPIGSASAAVGDRLARIGQ